ncbi:MAG: hypothetical protein JNN30_13095 [Rhodanobacteraceae bacterium]|nr:hypothetical protein [Rhodanobacteraceae bacterium]
MSKAIAPVLLLCGLLLAGAASAQTPAVDQRQADQRARINQGVASDELTRREAVHLRAEQAHIRQQEREAKADGVVTRRERRQLQRELDRSSAHIYEQKHDTQQRR